MNKWQRINYQPNVKLEGTGVTASEKHRTLSRDAAKEGMVLLKNRDNTLPLQKGSSVALFGKASFDYVKGGGGSGDVTVSYTTNIYEGLKALPDRISVDEDLAVFYRNHVSSEYEQGKKPGFVTEPDLPENLVKRVRAKTDTAIISICRYSGEGWDRKSSRDQKEALAEKSVGDTADVYNEMFEDGDYYLNQNEKEMVAAVRRHFSKIVVLMNVGGMVDSHWFTVDDSIKSVLMVWQGGMEGGSAAAELLCGIGSPSGKLADTFAKELDDYPSTRGFHDSLMYVDYSEDIYVGYRFFETIPGANKRVYYPFGFGLSYTVFEREHLKTTIENDSICVEVMVTNKGENDGKEVIQLYSIEPQGKLGKSAKRLVSFKKTRLLKRGESELVILRVPVTDLAAYDDTGKIARSAYVIEKGEYRFFLGNSVRDGVVLEESYEEPEDRIVLQLSEKLSPSLLKKRLKSDGTHEDLSVKNMNIEERSPGLEEPDLMRPPVQSVESYELTYLDRIMTLKNVYNGDISLDEFMDNLDDDDLIHLLGGQPNTGVANTFGWGNLPQYGIPNASTADGPAGLRIEKKCGVFTTAWPCATLLASTWDEDLLYLVGEAGAREVKENNLAVWLTPAVNIHRSPLCGRNFEYYSEDPLLSGKLAASMVRGIQSVGIAATVKHFAFNNKETNRKNSDSRVSERAAREVYLKAFEIIVKESEPYALMTAYNLVNGVRTSESSELLQDILRDEWGFSGVVTSDWWTNAEHYKEVLAGNDIKMGCGDPENLRNALDKGIIKRENLKQSAKRVLELILRID